MTQAVASHGGSAEASFDAVHDVVRRFWGFDTLRPLQADAIRAGLDGRDSLVVLPTGGGKSLCYQVPSVVMDRTDVVISPLISLMKDQVDGLRQAGYPAAAIHSNLDDEERRQVRAGLEANRFRLLFVSPERLVMPEFQAQLRRLGVRAFAIDEAHCISQWGHDFRLEYRQLAVLKERFPEASVHAFTATATPRVRDDIVHQLRLHDPTVVVGCFDRPNLTYRIVPRVQQRAQIMEVIARHPREAVIVYCMTRNETESYASALKAAGLQAAAYHAGLESGDRRRVQETFAEERLDVVVATVAFGMGIDRSNVRCVIHATMPKSIEHYQQETGRAGRDGLEAECVLLYSAADVMRWRNILTKNASDEDDPGDAIGAQLALLRHMQAICGAAVCRHRALSNYFGQDYEAEKCGACDVCLEEIDTLADSTTVAQKILSCVARLDQRFGVGQVVQVLRAADTESVRRFGHDRLSTHGLLSEIPEKKLTNLVYQLIDQGLLTRAGDQRPVLQLNDDSMAVLRGERAVSLLDPRIGRVRETKTNLQSWDGVDRALFERLRACRREIAIERGVPAYVVFSDATLRCMASLKPKDAAALHAVHGVGEKKLAEFGARFLEVIGSSEHEEANEST